MSTPTLQRARNHYHRQRRIIAAAVTAVRQQFQHKAPLPEIVSTVAAYQLASATASAASVAAMSNTTPNPLTIARAFAGVSSHGFPISEPIVATIDRFVPAPLEPLPDNWWEDQMAEFLPSIEQLVASEVADAGRTASQVEFVARPDWTNYVRMLNPPSCDRCAVLAGRIYRDLEAFQRHPNCFPAGTVVSGPATRGAARRWYEGELVVIRTAGGKELSATANHPVLTDQGWVPASLLTEGGYVVSRSSGDRSSALLVPDHDQMPARIEDLWSANGMSPLGRMPVAPQDFHGDGLGSSHVDVVLADGLMGGHREVALLQKLREKLLAARIELAVSLDPASAGLQFSQSPLLRFGSRLGWADLGGSLLGGHLAGAQQAGLAGPADRNACFKQSATDDLPREAHSFSKSVFTLAREVFGDDRLGVNRESPTPRWDAPTGEFSTESRAGYAERGSDLRERLAGQVELDRIVELRRVGFAGHVYNLTSSEGWYDANGLIVSNCDCVMVPVENWESAHDNGLITSPQELFDRGQMRGLSKADAQAITDGADIFKVVNAKRGLITPEVFGRKVKATTEGTTKRAAWRKANPSRLVRLRPESIYASAKDRDDAIRLLKLYGYIK